MSTANTGVDLNEGAIPDPCDERDTPALAKPHGSTAKYALVLGMLTAMGAFGIDTYLPAFKAIGDSLRVDAGHVQMSMVSYFVALAVGQAVYGPISDRHGRRGPLIFGFMLFVAASLACAFTTSIFWLVVMRFVQGIGACAGMVLTRAIVRDLRSGEEAARLFALMLLVLSVSPILAPIIGSVLLLLFPWPSIFLFMGGFGLFCLALIVFALEETNPVARRSGGLAVAFAKYGHLLLDKRFMVPVLIGGFSQGALFAYLTGSPTIFLELRGVSSTLYSVLFALNAMALIGSAQFNVRLMRRLGSTKLIVAGTIVQSVGALFLLTLTLTHNDTVPLLAAALFVVVGCQGLLGPTTAVLSLEPYAESAGAASALMGTVQFACGAIAGFLISHFYNGTSVPFAAVIAGCALAGLAFAVIFLQRRDTPRGFDVLPKPLTTAESPA